MRRDHQAPPVPLTPAVWAELLRRHAPRVRGLIVNGQPHIIVMTAPRREA